MARFCPTCGQALAEKVAFCSQCGHPVPPSSEPDHAPDSAGTLLALTRVQEPRTRPTPAWVQQSAPPSRLPRPPGAPVARGLRQRWFGTLEAKVITGLVMAAVVLGGGVTALVLAHGTLPFGPRSSGSPAGLQHYTAHLFRLAYPAGWGAQNKSTPLEASYEFRHPTSLNEHFAVIISQPPLPYAPTQAPVYLNLLCRQVSAPAPVTIGGQAWRHWDCRAGGLTNHQEEEAEIFYLGRLYDVAYGAPTPDFASAKAQFFEPMEQSFTFLT